MEKDILKTEVVPVEEEALKISQKEISRLAQNTKILFNLLPDMLLIIKDDFVIERMNRAAMAQLGNQHGRKCYEAIDGADSPCETGICPFANQNPEHIYGQMVEKKLGDNFYVEYCYVPFEGYRQDRLVLLIIRDITQKKLHELELQRYSQDIENILKEKIAVLKKSEQERKQLYQEVNYLKKETERFMDRFAFTDHLLPAHKSFSLFLQVIHLLIQLFPLLFAFF